MALSWGVKENVDPKYADIVKEYIADMEGSNVKLDSEKTVAILKAGLKERKGKYILIFRYQLV
ncbi:hypothetical protein FQB35_14890 [Crassaminicella thermophila]|uniref:Uncharacterized protein n=1 Tax=Crassaminicella thermophila TaxID=2599308 RepID=A0A5C0SJ19_CRATE|nr:hypothetical protein FQB35_14890 [Crassaminicella thermophila]